MIDGQRGVATRAARQEEPVLVQRPLHVDAGACGGRPIAEADIQRHALQRRCVNVLRRAVEIGIACENDQIAHAVAIGDDAGADAVRRIAKRHLGIARRLGLQIGIGRSLKVGALNAVP